MCQQIIDCKYVVNKFNTILNNKKPSKSLVQINYNETVTILIFENIFCCYNCNLHIIAQVVIKYRM